MDYRPAILIFMGAMLLTLPLLHTGHRFYTSDANVYYHTSQLVMENQSFSTPEMHKGWIELGGTYYPAMPVGYSLFAIPLSYPFTFDRSIGGSSAVLGPGFEPVGDTGLPGSLGFTSEAYLYLRYDSVQDVQISFSVRSPSGNMTLNVSRRGEILKSVEAGEDWRRITISTAAVPGVNRLRFSSSCENVNDIVPFSGSSSCVGPLLKRFWVSDSDLGTPYLDSEEFFRVEGTEKATFINSNSFPTPTRFSFDAWGYGGWTNLSVRTRYESYSVMVPESGRRVVTPPLLLPTGNATLNFSVDSSGDTCPESGSCAEAGVSRLKALEKGLFRSGNLLLQGKWYPPETGSRYWAFGDVEVLAPAGADSLSFSARGYPGGREVSVEVDGEPFTTLEIREKLGKYSIPLEGDGNVHRVKLEVAGDCVIPSKTTDSSDRRCLSAAFLDLKAG
ncbi:MAG: hypothetical protein ABEJ69_00015 [Candidatus Nanohaloarchaea archaeon]